MIGLLRPHREGADGRRGQALVEFALLTPALLLFVLLTVDVGRAYWQAIDGAGAARAGARMGVISDTSDIGSAVRDEPNTGIPNTLAAWGSEGPGTSWGTCITASGVCGDPSGCVSTSFSGTQVACFAIRTCNLSSGGDLGQCISYGAWGYRPDDGTGHGLQVLVVIKFRAVTPALSQIAGAASNGTIFIQQSAIGNELYF
ncbi:MAG TPA: TadE family protein [Candidatus Acidoferrum sp.]|nr:TadE family protein [Candidatus Acidoferrum sp.]